MAIYSLRHTPVGRSTQQRPHTAAAHVGYISRPQAARHVMAERMPEKPKAAAAYLRQMEDGDRANARVADKVMLALPKELNQEQRVQLVRDYANDVTKGRAPWLAAIHDKGKDVDNPHCHLLIRDRDPETGKRVIGMSDAGSTDMLREKWEAHANRALEQAGQTARIDRRSLKAQGIERAPTIHEGPNVRAMEARGARPRSRPRQMRNGRGARQRARQVDYPAIDRGQTRPAYNRSLRAPETEADYWDAIDRDAQQREFAERGLGADYRRWEQAAPRPESVEGIRGLAVQPKEGSHSVVTPRKLGPLPVPRELPSSAPGLAGGPGVLKPAAQRVAGGKREDELAHQFSARPVGAALRGERPKGRNTEEHNASMGQAPNSARGSAMSDDDDRLRKQHADERNRLKFEADQSRGRYDDLMRRSYLDPKAAEKRMDAYRAKHGNEALYDKLSDNARGTAFGRRPGSIASPEGYKRGAGDARQESQNARRDLPGAARKMHQDRERLGGAERTLQNSQPPPQQPAAQGAAKNNPPTLRPGAAQPLAPERRQPTQHRGLEQPGQPAPAPAKQQPSPDWAGMSPEARQAQQHKLMERPRPMPPMPPTPQSLAGRTLSKPAQQTAPPTPPMSTVPQPSKDKSPARPLNKKPEMEM